MLPRNSQAVIAQRILYGMAAIQARHLEDFDKVKNDLCELSVFKRKESQPDLLIDIFITKLTVKALLILNNLPPIEVLFQQQLDIDADLFFECLQNNIKLRVVNFQKKIKKAENLKMKQLLDRLKILKKDKNSLCETIFNLEKEVRALNNTKIRRLVRISRIWQVIHLQKASHAFYSLAKLKKI